MFSRHRVGLLLLATALITGTGGTATAVTHPHAAAPAAATFTDDFDGAAGAGVDQSKWRFETGDNVNNHEREWYTSGTHNAALDGQGHLVITARKDNPGNYQCWYGTCQYTSARMSTPAIHPGVRPLRGPDEDPARSGHVAGVLDARQ